MVRPSFVPAEPMRQVRDWTRDRFDLVADRTRVRQRVEKLLEDALLKMSVVITDIFGVSGRAIMAALIDGERDPAALVALAVPRIDRKSTRLNSSHVEISYAVFCLKK